MGNVVCNGSLGERKNTLAGNCDSITLKGFILIEKNTIENVMDLMVVMGICNGFGFGFNGV